MNKINLTITFFVCFWVVISGHRPSEETVKSIHFNSKESLKAKVVLDAFFHEITIEKGMGWIEKKR